MQSTGEGDRHRDLLFATCAAAALVVFGVVTHGGLPTFTSSSDRSDSRIYLSMAAHRWIDAPSSQNQWTLYDVPAPFRYRILVPWLAEQLPFGPVRSLALVNYVSLFGAYLFLLLACRRLGVNRAASAIGLGVAFTFVSHLTNYSLPWLTDGFILFALSAMTYAFVADRFWMFAGCGLIGIFAREAPALLLPVWCVRNVRRGLAVTVIAVAAITLERMILLEPSGLWSVTHPSWLLNAVRETFAAGPSGASYWPPRFSWKLLIDIEYCWGWAFAVLPIGLLLLPRDAVRRFLPVAGVLLASACAMSLVATDTWREFMVLLPVITVATAQLVAALARQRHIAWLTLLLPLAALQFCLSEQNTVLTTEMWRIVSARVPLIKIGVAWVIGAAIFLRTDLTCRLREITLRSERRSAV